MTTLTPSPMISHLILRQVFQTPWVGNHWSPPYTTVGSQAKLKLNFKSFLDLWKQKEIQNHFWTLFIHELVCQKRVWWMKIDFKFNYLRWAMSLKSVCFRIRIPSIIKDMVMLKTRMFVVKNGLYHHRDLIHTCQ